MKAEVKKLFERYCESKNVFPKSVEEMEPLLRDFFGLLNQDLVRGFYSKGFSKISADIPELIEPLQALIAAIPPLQDPRLQALRQQKNNITPQRTTTLQEHLKLYQLCTNEQLLAFQENPSDESLTKLVKEFDLKQWMQAFTKLESSTTKIYDTQYHQLSKKFFADLNKVSGQIENSTLPKKQSQAVMHHLLSSFYGVARRGEIGKELTDLALTGRLSFLCYAEIFAQPEEEFTNILPTSLVISQWDWLHDNQLLQKELFIDLRKSGVDEIRKELQERIEMVKLLSKLNKNKWIDPKQSETILKNSVTQRAAKSLDTLQFFLIKKEVVALVHARAKGAADETDIKNRLAALIKRGPNPELKKFYNKLLDGAETLQERVSQLTIEVIRNFLMPPKKTLFGEFRDEILNSPKKPPPATPDAGAPPASKKPPPPTPDAEAPPASSASSAEVSPAESPPPGSEEILQEVADLQKQLSEAANVMSELTSNHQGKKAIAFLEDKQILLPDTEQVFHKKIQILLERLKEGSKEANLRKMIGQMKVDIRNNSKFDTRLFILQETLKQYENKPSLTQEEMAVLGNMKLPIQERGFMLDQCGQKYQILNELKAAVPDKKSLAALQLEKAPPILVNILQDILKKQPFYFSKDTLNSFKNYLPNNQSAEVEASRTTVHDLYKSFVGGALLSKLVQWGLWKIDGAEQIELIKTITNSLSVKSVNAQKWNKFKSVSISKKSLEGIAQSVPPNLEKNMDEKGRTVLSNMKTVILKNDEDGIKGFSKKDISYLANSLVTTEYITQIRDLIDSFSKIQEASKIGGASAQNKAGSSADLAKYFEATLGMEFHDQRLEMLLDELVLLLPEDSPLIETGKKLYFDFTGFKY